MILAYTLAFAISIILFGVLVWSDKRPYVFYFLIAVMIMIADFGYLNVALSKRFYVALLAKKFAYIGNCYLPYLMYLTVAHICKRKIKTWVTVLLFIVTSLIYFAVFTSGFQTWYYKDIDLVFNGKYSYLASTYGPVYYVFLVSIIFYLFLSLEMVLISLKNKHIFSFFTGVMIITGAGILIGGYSLELLLNLQFSLMPFTYLIAEMILIGINQRMNLFDVSGTLSKNLEISTEVGYILFDSKKNFTSASKFAQKYFPEIKNLETDSPVPDSAKNLKNHIEPQLFAHDRGELKSSFYIESNGRELKCTIRDIKRSGLTKKKAGYIVEIRDDTDQRKYIRLINDYNAELERSVEQKIGRINMMQHTIIMGIADVVGSRDSSTGGHVKRTSVGVQILVEAIKKSLPELDHDEAYWNSVVKAAPLHDFGKIAIDDVLLRKPGMFLPEEFEAMKSHTSQGAKLLKKVLENIEDARFIEIAVNMAHFHHEKWNGSGYPLRLVGEEIPLEARIMALADVFDALVSERCYKQKYTFSKAFAIIEESLGSHFDPELGKIFISCRDQLEEYYSKLEQKHPEDEEER